MANPELKWWHVRWGLWGRRLKKVGFWLAVVLAVGWTIDLALVGCFRFFGPYLSVRSLGNEPQAWLVPAPVPDQTVVQLSGSRIEAFGYSIQTPWSEQPEIRTGAPSLSARFPKEGVLLVLDNPDFAGGGNAQRWRTMPTSGRIFRDQERGSNYGLMAAVMATTPRDAAWWKARSENERVLALLSCKFFAATEPSAIYNVNGPAMKGFEFESRLAHGKLVQLSLFDSADRQFDIQIFDGIGDKPTLMQEQINAMVASIRPVEKK
jgi:hypothetical protein